MRNNKSFLGDKRDILSNEIPEILFCNYKNEQIAYVPSRGIAFKVNLLARNKIASFQVHTSNDISRLNEKILSDCFSKINTYKRRKLVSSHSIPFTELVLLLTRNCNLRCKYCYSEGGSFSNTITPKIINSAIEIVFKQIKEANKKNINISYHGGGEPTLAWDLLTSTNNLILKKSKSLDINVRTRITSNGVLSKAKAEWIAKTINSVLISMDGPSDVMNLHRPMANGSNPTSKILETIKILRDNNHKIKIRATISNYSVSQLSDLVDYFVKIGASFVQLEPLTIVGRASKSKITKPDPNEFCENFYQAKNLGKKLDCKVTCSYLRPTNYADAFCSSSLGRALIITPEGNITLCHRISNQNDIGSKDFLIGNYDSNFQRLEIDYSKMENIRKQSSFLEPECRECVAKYSCFGGCPAQNIAVTNDRRIPDKYRCIITKNLFGKYLSDSLINAITY